MPQNDHEKLRSRTRRDSLSTQIADQMTEEIRRGTYTPGSVLPSEHALCDQYQVSRPVVREAFKLLSAQGLVEIQSGKGAIVQEINDTVLRSFFKRLLSKDDPEALIDLLEVRKVLEVKSAEDAAERCSPEELAQLRNILDQMRAQTNNYDAYSRLDVEFHVRLAEFSRNSFLLYLTSSIRDSLVEVINELQIRQYQPELPTIQTYLTTYIGWVLGWLVPGSSSSMR